MGVCDRVVKVVDFKPLTSHRSMFDSRRHLRIFSCQKDIKLDYETSLVLLRCQFVLIKEHLRSSFTSTAERSPYEHYTVLARRRDK
jgi:hypothetical protein